MAYAQLADVLARAGRVAVAWDATTDPGYPAIERFLDDAAAEIDALIAGARFTVPVTADPPLGSLRKINAVGALAAAIAATFPSGGNDAATVLGTRAQADYDAAMARFEDGTHPALVFLDSATESALATDFWSENPNYGLYPGTAADPYGRYQNPWLAPTIRRGEAF